MTGKKKELLWTNIHKVTFNKLSQELKLSTDNTSIKLHMHLVGFNNFVELLKKKLSIEIYYKAIASIEAVQKRY